MTGSVVRNDLIAGGLTVVLAGMLSQAALAQGDAIVAALNRCNDPANTAQVRISNCVAVINARGLDQDEVAFAWLGLGLAYQPQGTDRQHELEAYSKAIELQPALWQARANRAVLYLEAGDGVVTARCKSTAQTRRRTRRVASLHSGIPTGPER